MSKCRKRSVSHDGSLKVGGPAPSWTLNETGMQKNYGAISQAPWNAIADITWREKLKSEQTFIANRRENDIKVATENYNKSIAEARIKPRIGKGKTRMTDEQVIYCRKEFKTKSIRTLCEELKLTRRTIENAVKGITYKHLNAVSKPFL